ncbi:MAG: TOTE conflict system archaeo-eukaryotic primase domain-containing protein [Ktedonobacteraceae bacterium]
MISHDVLQHFVSRFISRRDDYALQQPTGRYLRANRPLMQNMLRRHVDGVETVGTYVMDERGMCRYAVFDADSANGLDVLLLLSWQLVEEGIPSYLEQSRRGGHLWVLLDGLYPASVVRRWLLPLCPAGVEFYPKQDEGCGYGSLIRLPLGLHLRSGCRYPFLAWSDEEGHLVPVASSVGDTLQWLAMAERVAVPTALLAAQLAPCDALSSPTHPSLATAIRVSTRAPSTMTIHDWCLTQDAATVIGHYVALDYRGMGCCPFGEHHRSGRDTHPSFRVYAPRSATASCWYCYTAQQGGNLFDFLSRYYGLDTRTLWHHILSGAVF